MMKRYMNTVRRAPRLAAALAAVVVLAAAGRSLQAQNAPAVLSEVPDSAQVVMVVNNIKGLSTKLSNAATRMNLPVPQDIVGTITKNVGVKEGLDQNGSMAFVVMPSPEKVGQAAEENIETSPEMVMILPTTDAKAMLAPFKPTAAEKGISEVTMPNDGDEKGYVAVVGKFVALAEKKEHLTHFLARKGSLEKTLSAESSKAIAANDFTVYANMPAINKAYSKKLDEAQQFFTAMLDLQNMAGGEDKPGAAMQQAMQKEVVGMYFSTAKQFLSDANAGLVTARLTDAGATFGVVGNFKPDSSFGKFVTAQKGKGNLTLNGLPATGEILAIGAFSWDTATVSDLFGKVADKVLANPALKPKEEGDAKKAEFEQIRKMVDLQKQMLAITSGGSFVVVAPPAAEKDAGWMRGSILAETTDPQKYIDLSMQYAKLSIGGMGGMSPDVETIITADEKGATIKGVKLHKFTVTFKARDENNEASKMAVQMVNKLYGPNGLTVYSGVVGKRVLSVMGDDQKLVEASIEAAQKNVDTLSALKEVAAVKTELVKNPVMVAYLPVERWINLAKRAGAGADGGGEVGIAIADAPTPVVMSVGVEGPTATMEVFVPMSTLSQAAQGVRDILPFLGGGMFP